MATVLENEIATAAARVATCCGEAAAAIARGDVTPGTATDLASVDFQRSVLPVLTESIPLRDLKDLGAAFGDIAVGMTAVAARRPELDDDDWQQLLALLGGAHAAWGPYEFVVADNRRLDVVGRHALDETRCARLAELATHEAIVEMRDAAESVFTRVTATGES